MIPTATLGQSRGLLREPITSDRELLFAWRNAENVRRFMVHDSLIKWEEHCAWFQSIQECRTTLFFVFEIDAVPAGAVHFTELDRATGVTHWGFYVDPSRPKLGLGTAMAYLALNRAFDEFGFGKVIADVIKFNDRSIAFHCNLGFRLTGAYRDTRTEDRGGVLVFELREADWHACRGEVRRRLVDRRPEFAWLP